MLRTKEEKISVFFSQFFSILFVIGISLMVLDKGPTLGLFGFIFLFLSIFLITGNNYKNIETKYLILSLVIGVTTAIVAFKKPLDSYAFWSLFVLIGVFCSIKLNKNLKLFNCTATIFEIAIITMMMHIII